MFTDFSKNVLNCVTRPGGLRASYLLAGRKVGGSNLTVSSNYDETVVKFIFIIHS